MMQNITISNHTITVFSEKQMEILEIKRRQKCDLTIFGNNDFLFEQTVKIKRHHLERKADSRESRRNHA